MVDSPLLIVSKRCEPHSWLLIGEPEASGRHLDQETSCLGALQCLDRDKVRA